MDRRTFLKRSSLLAAGGFVLAATPALAEAASKVGALTFDVDLYRQLQCPDTKYRPYVRWWWNGDKIEAAELIRELHVLKAAGIGGVEINPVKFPDKTDDLGKETLQWLSEEWIDMLQVTFDEAKKLGMTCDMIVGSGWPFGAEYLQGDERGQVMVIGVKRLTGPMEYATSRFNLFKEADPALSHPYSGRTMEMHALTLVPDPISSMDQVMDLSGDMDNELITVKVPEGKHVLYALVKINSFAAVIQGAPGATGPTLNHLNTPAVEKYLNTMSAAIQQKTGPLSNHIRSFFTDSLELEGANWTPDMAEHFKARNGYDIMPYLPFTMFKTGSMGNVLNFNYGTSMTPEFKEMINRMRYDFEVTKAEMFRDRFTIPYTAWCRKLGVQSRAQAYGRGFFPLESGMYYDIPEGESWSTNYLQHRLGEEMGNEDYRRGRAYTMVNKFISSGAHLTGKRVVSCEEMTNSYRVFNATLEFLKMGSDMSIISGITHSIYHGFNYSPPEAAFPGWVLYGTYHSERNNWWPYANRLNDYKGRLSALLCNADMYADIAILPPVSDMWTLLGVQNEPFPSITHIPWMTLVWEAMSKNGNATDYVSEPVIRDSQIKNGELCYNKRRYKTLFLIEVESMEPETLAKLHEFVVGGGRIFCMEKYPHKSLGWKEWARRDQEVRAWVERLKTFPDRFILLQKPADNDFMAWYPAIQAQYHITPYVQISDPNVYVMQNRYQRDNHSEIFFIVNSNLHESHTSRFTFPPEVTKGRYGWVWDMDKGERYRINLIDNGIDLDLGPTESVVIVFDKQKKGTTWSPLPASGSNPRILLGWEVELQHSLLKSTQTIRMEELTDLKETKFESFTGRAIYRTSFDQSTPPPDLILNLGKVYGVCEVKVNGQECGVTWYGRRLYNIAPYLQAGTNEIQVSVVTSMGNYLKTLTEDPIAQKWTNRPGRPQPVQSMGLAGPVTLYTL